MLSQNPEDIEIAKILIEKDPETKKRLLKIAKYLGPRFGADSDDEFFLDVKREPPHGENLYFNIHKMGLLEDTNILFGRNWNNLGNLTKRGKYYKSAIKALRELRQ